MDWDDLKLALAIARHGSLTAAARALGVSQPTVGRRLESFERKIGVNLFDRSLEGLKPTTLGAALFDSLSMMEEGALSVERRIASRNTGLEGPIVVTSLDWLADFLTAPIVARFAALHPLVSIELLNDTRVFNLSRHEADIAFRFGKFEQEDLVVRKVADVAYGLYASSAYLERMGLPDIEAGCPDHTIVMLHQAAGHVCYRDWLAALAPNAHVLMRTNSVQSHIATVEAGIAMGVLPRYVADQRDGLIRIETGRHEPVQSVQMGVHADMRDNPRVRALLDFAAREFRQLSSVLAPG